MEPILDINTLVDRLTQDKVSPQEWITRNLYYIKRCCNLADANHLRNKIQATIALIKVLYDISQQMALARVYLMHRVKLLEVRECDRNAEISIMRGVTSSIEERLSFGGRTHRDVLYDEMEKKDHELEIIMDTKMIGETDQSKELLMDINNQLTDKKRSLLDIEHQINLTVTDSVLLDNESNLTSSNKLELPTAGTL